VNVKAAANHVAAFDLTSHSDSLVLFTSDKTHVPGLEESHQEQRACVRNVVIHCFYFCFYHFAVIRPFYNKLTYMYVDGKVLISGFQNWSYFFPHGC
jgi:hypothetical protein